MLETANPIEIVNVIKELVPTFNPQNEAYQDKVDAQENATEKGDEVNV